MQTLHKKLLIFIPTYNEVDNVEPLLKAIKNQKIKDADILFMDDNSPDKTGEKLDFLAKKEKGVLVIHRQKKLGIGSAHQAGISYAYRKGYQKLLTMDCDFTHNPEYIQKLIGKSTKADIVVTGRHKNKAGLKNWKGYRKVMTKFGHFMTKVLLDLDFDASGAFRVYNLNSIPRKVFKLVRSLGYSFFFESLHILNRNGYKITEVPVILPARTQGKSKMRTKDVVESFKFLLDLYFRTNFTKDIYLIKHK